MHDAVTLANWIVTLQAPSLSELNTIFKEYRDERYPVAKEEYLSSQGFTDILGKVKPYQINVMEMKRMMLNKMCICLMAAIELPFNDCQSVVKEASKLDMEKNYNPYESVSASSVIPAVD